MCKSEQFRQERLQGVREKLAQGTIDPDMGEFLLWSYSDEGVSETLCERGANLVQAAEWLAAVANEYADEKGYVPTEVAHASSAVVDMLPVLEDLDPLQRFKNTLFQTK